MTSPIVVQNSSLSATDHQLIFGSVREVDLRQIAVYRQLTPAQRVWQCVHHSAWLRQVNIRRQQRKLRETPMKTSGENTFLTLADFARLVLEALQAAQCEYMLVGAFSVAAWAEARSTQDVDMVIHVPLENMKSLSQELEKRAMLVPFDIILDIYIENRADTPVNAIHLHTGYKAELFLLRPEIGDEYAMTAFARRVKLDLGPPLGEVYVNSPEDLILSKLRFFKISHQPKHTRDIASIILELADELDRPYIEAWAARLDTTDIWQEILRVLPTY